MLSPWLYSLLFVGGPTSDPQHFISLTLSSISLYSWLLFSTDLTVLFPVGFTAWPEKCHQTSYDQARFKLESPAFELGCHGFQAQEGPRTPPSSSWSQTVDQHFDCRLLSSLWHSPDGQPGIIPNIYLNLVSPCRVYEQKPNNFFCHTVRHSIF